MGASFSVASHWAFQGLTRTAARDCALFLLPQSEQGQKEKENESSESIVEGIVVDCQTAGIAIDFRMEEVQGKEGGYGVRRWR